MTQRERQIYLLKELLKEQPQYANMEIPADSDEQKQLLRGLMNIRPPKQIAMDFLAVQDAYLQAETAAKGITDACELIPVSEGLFISQGDIITLRCDAIINATNSGMTGMLYSLPPLY